MESSSCMTFITMSKASYACGWLYIHIYAHLYIGECAHMEVPCEVCRGNKQEENTWNRILLFLWESD